MWTHLAAIETLTPVDPEKADLVVVGVADDTLSRVCIPVSILHVHQASVMALAAYVQHLDKVLSTLSTAQHSLSQFGTDLYSMA